MENQTAGELENALVEKKGLIPGWLKYHVVDGTALLAASNPVYSAFEVGLAGMSDDVSIKARSFATLLTFLGMGTAFSRGRDVSRKLFHITDKTNEAIQYTHDTIYTAAFNLAVAPPIYLASGSRDLKEIAIGTGIAMAFSAVNGPLMGYAVDVFRDLTGLRKSERKSYPKFIRKQKPTMKKTLAALLTAGSVAAMVGIYALTPNGNQDNDVPIQPPAQEIVYNKSQRSREFDF